MRFLCDAMLGGLAKWMRAAGYTMPTTLARGPTSLTTHWSGLAIEEGRVLLTSDRGFLERKPVRGEEVPPLMVPHLPLEDQLRLVIGSFDLVRRPSRCMACNGELEMVRGEAVVERVPPELIRAHQRFFRCRGCNRVFWYGSHWERIGGRLERVFGARGETKPTIQADVLAP